MTHGGSRPGAGRPAKPKPAPLPAFCDPLDFLRAVMNDPRETVARRVRAAVAMLPFLHVKAGEAGKKVQAAVAAKKAGGKFRPASPPVRVLRNTPPRPGQPA